jgi:hypothetical protein
VSWQPPVHPSVDPNHPITAIYGRGHLHAEYAAVALAALAKAGVEEPLRTALAADALAEHEQASLTNWLATSWSASYPEHVTGRLAKEAQIQALRALVATRAQQLADRQRAAAA